MSFGIGEIDFLGGMESFSKTINTDDLIIFNQSISEEYLNLYNSKLMTADELDDIRKRGLIIY